MERKVCGIFSTKIKPPYLTLFLCAQNYFRRHAPCESAPYGISPEVMDTYVKSCGMDNGTKHTVTVTKQKLFSFFNLLYHAKI